MSRQLTNDPGWATEPDFEEEPAGFIAEFEAEALFASEMPELEKGESLPSSSPEPTSDDQVFDAAHIYLEAAQRSKLLSFEEEQHYGRLARQGDLEARRIMIERNLRLVVNLARHYVNRGLPLMDMIEEGNIGLIRAVEKFKPELGFRFSTYATWWVRQSIERAIMNQSRTIRLPINVLKEMNAYLKAFRSLANTLDHEPTSEEIASHLHKPVTKVEKMHEMSERMVVWNSAQARLSEKNWAETIAEEDKPSPTDITHQAGMSSHVSYWLAQLTVEQREVISRHYGLHGYEQASLPEIAKAMDLTCGRVRRLQHDAMGIIRKLAAEEGMQMDAIFL